MTSHADPHTIGVLQIVTSGELRCQFAERTFAGEGIDVQTIESRIELKSQL